MWLSLLTSCLLRQSHIRQLQIARRSMSEMARVFVRSVENEDRLQLRFRYHPDGQQPPAKLRVYNFDRLKTEYLERTMTHIATKISKAVMKRAKKKSRSLGADVDVAEVRVALSEDGSDVSTSELNESAWIDGRCMHIEDQLFHVCVNVPTVRKLSLPQPMMVGFPVYAKMDIEFTDICDCEFIWYRLSKGVTFPPREKSNNHEEEHLESDVTEKCMNSEGSEMSAVKIFAGRAYIPTVEDIGCQLKLECIPVRGDVTGEMATALSSAAVCAGPDISFPFEKRHKYTEQLTLGNWCVLHCVTTDDDRCYDLVSFGLYILVYRSFAFNAWTLFSGQQEG